MSVSALVPVSIEVGDRTAEVEQAAKRPWVRSPGDLLRVIVATLVFLLVFGVFDLASNTLVGLHEDVTDAISGVPRVFVFVMYAILAVVASIIPVGVLIWVLVRRRWRLLGVYLLTTLTASVVFDVLQNFIAAREPEVSGSPVAVPDWASDEIGDPAWAAGYAAALVVSSPWMTRRWRRVAWASLLLVFPMRLVVGIDIPSGLLLGIAGGWLIGSIAVLAFGSPQRRPTAADIVRALDGSGLHLVELKRAAVDARGSTPYFGVDVHGRRYFVKALGADERNADLMFRVYRWFRLNDVGDERPFSSLRRAVEHEALVAVMADRAGVTTPPFVATVELPDGSMVLVYERIDGRSLDSVEPELLTPAVLAEIWRQVALLHNERIAHRDLRLANVFLTGDDRPMLIDFGFGEIAVSGELLAQDVAQLMVSTAILVGAERAVAAAVRGVGADAVHDAAPRLQPIALAGATQSALKQDKGLLEQVREQVKQQTGLADIELVKIERVKPRTILLTALLFGAVWFLIPQLAELPRIMDEIRDASWVWMIPAVVFSMLTYVGAAMALTSSVQQRLSVLKATLVTLGGSFVNRISPAKIGGIALNIRFLQKQGIDTPVAAASVGLYQSVGLLVHLTLLLVFGIWAGREINYTEFLPSWTVILIVVAVVLTALGVLIAVPKLRHLFTTQIKPQIGKIGANLRDLLQHPVRLLVMVVGSAVLTMSYVGALWASIQAFGGGVPIAGIAVVFLAGASIASAAPTPGGIGAVEAALVAGLTALGLAAEIAVPAVFLYRLATFWVPIIPGWIGFTILQRRGDI